MPPLRREAPTPLQVPLLRLSRPLVLAGLIAFLGLGQPIRGEGVLKLSFGVYATDKPTEMYRQFKPAVLYLESYLSENLSRSVQVKFHIFRSYDSAREALVAGDLDFARFGPGSYILAQEQAISRGRTITLLAMEQESGKLSFNGVIFTRVDSGIDSIAMLRGRTFAFADRTSTIGRYLSQELLLNSGIRGSDLERYEYLERHDQVVGAVLAGKFDAGAAKEETFLKFKDKGLKALVNFPNVTKPWVGRGDLDPQVTAAIRQGLLTLKDQKVLDALGGKITGFAPASDNMYHEVRTGMEKAKLFSPEDSEERLSTPVPAR
jgi:phosphonate transport system substrate-binding protein